MTDEERIKAAKRLEAAEWRKKNKKKIAEYHRKWTQDNPEKVKEHQKNYWLRKADELKIKG